MFPLAEHRVKKLLMASHCGHHSTSTNPYSMTQESKAQCPTAGEARPFKVSYKVPITSSYWDQDWRRKHQNILEF